VRSSAVLETLTIWLSIEACAAVSTLPKLRQLNFIAAATPQVYLRRSI
jgi:hypothetical protein